VDAKIYMIGLLLEFISMMNLRT